MYYNIDDLKFTVTFTVTQIGSSTRKNTTKHFLQTRKYIFFIEIQKKKLYIVRNWQLNVMCKELNFLQQLTLICII